MRKLSPEDRRLWDFVTRSVTPLTPRHATPEPAPAPPARRIVMRPSETPPAAQRPAAHRPLQVGRTVDLDAATARKFRKGRMPCDGTLDLHGLTVAQAHAALDRFVRHNAERGARCLLVVTGKGDSRAEPARGRIKAELMHWLNAAPLRPLILAVTEAHRGGGAVYVLLRRRRD
jgi:DNA-nicking Smr family endonuclease